MVRLAAGRRAAAASQVGVAEVVSNELARGNAVDAACAGVLAAAALAPSVLLGPVQILIGGAGAGLRAVDGRCLQPGKGGARPRGFVAGEAIAPASRVATPVLPAALVTAVVTFGGSSFSRVAGPAVDLARERSEARAKLLGRVARHGATVFSDGGVAGDLIAAVGRVAGGLLGAADLDEARPTVEVCAVEPRGDRRVARAPWRGEPSEASSAHVEVIAATDARGLVCVACYEMRDEGVTVPELGLVAPYFAAPVMRGETRVRPGDRRPAAAPIALAESESVVDLAIGASGVRAEAALEAFFASLAEGTVLDDALLAAASGGGARLRGIARSKVGARALVA